MTLLVKCNKCGKIEEAGPNGSNPVGWYSRTVKGKEEHACCRGHIPDGTLIGPW